jgi:hypothetical protein
MMDLTGRAEKAKYRPYLRQSPEPVPDRDSQEAGDREVDLTQIRFPRRCDGGIVFEECLL